MKIDLNSRNARAKMALDLLRLAESLLMHMEGEIATVADLEVSEQIDNLAKCIYIPSDAPVIQ